VPVHSDKSETVSLQEWNSKS